MGKNWGQGGSGGNWRAVRQAVLDRDNYECQLQFENVCTGIAFEVHHQHGLGGQPRETCDDPDECIAVCRECHAVVTERQKRFAKQKADALRAARRKLPVQPHPGEMRR